MAALRTTIPSSHLRVARPAAMKRCAFCLQAQRCRFSLSAPRVQSSKRPLMTESAHRPPSLESQAPPISNRSQRDSSMSNESPQSWPPRAPWQTKERGIEANEPDSEAIKTRTSTLAEANTSQAKITQPVAVATATKPRKSKLRPRKAPITLTDTAVRQLKALFEQPESKMIRIGVKNRGCSGLAYHLEYVDRPGAFDETVEQDGVTVLIDSKALFSIIGSEMDWLEDKLSARFIFKNPNITEQCGCGESFSIS